MPATNAFKDDASASNRYLADQLTDAERAAYEAHLLENPEALDEIEAAARFKVGLHKLRSTGELPALLQATPTYRQPWVLALAAVLAVVVIGVGLVRWNTTTTPSVLASSLTSIVDPSGRALPVAKTYALLKTRTENYDAVIALPRAPRAIELRILPDAPDEQRTYRVSLTYIRDDGSTEAVASLNALRPQGDGFVSVFADSSRLSPGRYLLALTPEDAQSTETFLMKLTRE